MDVDMAVPTAQVSIKHGLPEIEIFCYLLVLIFLIDNKKYDEVLWDFCILYYHMQTANILI